MDIREAGGGARDFLRRQDGGTEAPAPPSMRWPVAGLLLEPVISTLRQLPEGNKSA